MNENGDVTRLLSAIARGDKGAWDQLFPLVYERLRMLASRQLRTLCFTHQHFLDPVAVGETVGNPALVLDLMTGNDLSRLRVLFAGTHLRVVRGRQGAIMLGTFRLQPLHIDLVRIRPGPGPPLFCLLANDLRRLVLLDQAGLEQLFLQRVAHEGAVLAVELAGSHCSVRLGGNDPVQHAMPVPVCALT